MEPGTNSRVVVVTGASRGIGSAIARAFAAEGARVVVNYRRDVKGASTTLAAIEAGGATGKVVQADIADPTDVERLVTTTLNDFGRIDVLVNNAAAFSRSPFLETSLEELDHILDVNVRGLFRLSQLVAHSMAGAGGGAIIHVSSILARLAVPHRAAYALSKGAIESLTRAMALDLADSSVRVNAVAPGLISTDALLAGMPQAELQESVQRHIPGGRFGEPDEVAAVVTFLASEAARYVNGTVVGVDAGLGGREAGPIS